jgi:hypothetical protein
MNVPGQPGSPFPLAAPALRPCRSVLALCLALSACGTATGVGVPGPAAGISYREPPFVSASFEAFSRSEAVAIALREWRAWGQLVDDDPPDTRPPPPPEEKPERMAGMWERVGEYWWLGQNPDRPESGWTGRHDQEGTTFSADTDENYAWSAAFISYVMRMAGAGARFPYSPSHSTYINIARQMSLGQTQGWAVWAEPIDTAVPQPGDLICYGRHNSRSLRFTDLPAPPFPGHCDIVVSVAPDALTTLGGNVDDAVTMRHVPVTQTGTLAEPGRPPLDTRWPWFVVVRILYDR